ncbi:hypothetical protein BGZ89_003508 [Linnemannia elongata]|nr:hypothetical protein BGZ89_003508 [Linnemannia elongata]
MKIHFGSLHKEAVRDACHCVFMNPRTLTIWCYFCECELNPFTEDNLISPTGRLFLKTAVRCMQGKKSKQDGDGTIQDLDLTGLVGLKNLGNTCYMNAALQALAHTPALTQYFQTCEAFIPESRRVEYARQKNIMLVDSFFNFVDSMWSGKSAIFSPAHLVSDYPDPNMTLPTIPIQDEKLNKAKAAQPPQKTSVKSSNGTSKDTSRPSNPKAVTTSSLSYASSRSSTSSRSLQSSENSSLVENAEITPARVTNPSIISDLFEGTLESRVRCLSCRKEYIKEDKFFDLSIPIDKKNKIIDDALDDKNGKDKEGGVLGSFVDSIGGWLSINNRNIKLTDCLASFCATEELTGEDRYRCTQCDALNDCRKTFKITRLPETLCIHLKRFRYDSYSSKINTYVQFPMEDLDMTPFLKSTDHQELSNSKYDLYAMVRHRGVVGGGHYIGYAKHAVDGCWYEFDDTYVTRKAPADVAKMEAYILFYQRKSPHRDEDRTRISKYMTKPLMQIYDKDLLVYISSLWLCRWKYLTSYEEAELDERRRREEQDVARLDSTVISEGQLWYLIGADWLKEWHAFKAGDKPPGPIRNSQFLKDNGQPRAGMKRGTDYRGINVVVWNYLQNIYGGGPEFVRAALDLYAPDPKTSPISPVRNNARTIAFSHQHQLNQLPHPSTLYQPQYNIYHQQTVPSSNPYGRGQVPNGKPRKA